MSHSPDPDAATLRAQFFAKSVPDQERLHQIVRQLGPAGGGVCLEVAVGDGALSAELRKLPGRWTTVTLEAGLADELRSSLNPDTVLLMEEGRIPFPDQTFDFVVLPDTLPAVGDDYEFIRECHRVLRPKSYLLATVPNLKRYSLARAIRRLLGVSELKPGFVRPGYSERHLYDLFKDGYDIVEAHTWSRFFLETAHTLTQVLVGAAAGRASPTSADPVDQARLRRALGVLAVCHPFVRLASWLDRLIRFTGGHQRIALIKTRMWIPRREVKIRDGRSIADATVNTRIGSAKEF